MIFQPLLTSRLTCSCVIDKDLSYDHLALGLKEALEKDKSAFDADRLQKYTGTLISSYSSSSASHHTTMIHNIAIYMYLYIVHVILQEDI